MGCVVLTAKHHDGYCLFDSAHTDFSLPRSRAKRDVVAELQRSCAERGLKMGCYYSPRDWDHPDYMPYEHFDQPGPRYGGCFGFSRNKATGPIDMYGLKPGYAVTADDFHDCGCIACTNNLPLAPRATPVGDLQKYLSYYHAQRSMSCCCAMIPRCCGSMAATSLATRGSSPTCGSCGPT